MNAGMITELENQRNIASTRAAQLAAQMHSTQQENAKLAQALKTAEARIAELTPKDVPAGPAVDAIHDEAPAVETHEKRA